MFKKEDKKELAFNFHTIKYKKHSKQFMVNCIYVGSSFRIHFVDYLFASHALRNIRSLNGTLIIVYTSISILKNKIFHVHGHKSFISILLFTSDISRPIVSISILRMFETRKTKYYSINNN